MWGALCRVVAVGSIASLAGCGGTSGDSAPTEWQGATPHLNVVGFIDGENINIQLTGADAANTAKLWCEREYQVPTDTAGNPIYNMGHNSEVRIRLPATTTGMPARGLAIELKMHDYQDDAAGTTTPVIVRDDNNPPCTADGCAQPKVMWLGWTWHDLATDAVIYKMAAQSGSYKSGEFTGAKDSTGLFIMENSGNVGGFATGQWSTTEKISVSFDAKCTANNVDNG
jgi:hypothetical protein